MKRLTLLVLAIIGFSCALPFPALGQQAGLIGTWTIPTSFQGKAVTLNIRFDANGRYWQWYPEYGTGSQGTYSTFGNELRISKSDGLELRSHFYFINSNILIMQNREGRFQYTRVADRGPEPPRSKTTGQDLGLHRNQPQVGASGMRTAPGSTTQARETPYERGCKFFEQGDLQQALAAFDQAIAQDPNNAPALYKRGLVYEKLNDLLKSYDDLEKACSLDPDNDEYRQAIIRVGYPAVSKGLEDAWDAAIALGKRQKRERLSKELPYRLVGSMIGVLLLAVYWFFFSRTRKTQGAPRSGSKKYLRASMLIFGMVLTILVMLFISGTMAPYFTSK